MPQIKRFYEGGEVLKLAASEISEESAARLKSQYGGAALDKIFNDADLLNTCFCLLDNDLNVSLTARKMYMHRNTLIYRINAMQKACGLDICKFSDAVIFTLLYAIYTREKK